MTSSLLRRPAAMAGIMILAGILFLALAAPVVAPHDPLRSDLDGALEGPSAAHLFGQDKLGRDVFSQVVYGARASTLVALSVVAATVTAGILMGSLAGYFGGLVDVAVMRTVDVLLAFPGILLAIALAGVLGPSLWNIVFALSVLGWVGYARLVRAQFLTLREREYVQAVRAAGAGPLRIIGRHLLPNALSPVIVQATFSAAGVIIAESSLSFLGLGPQDIPTWGGTLSEGANYLLYAPHVAFFPGLFIMITVLALNLVGDSLRDLLDPKFSPARDTARQRRASRV